VERVLGSTHSQSADLLILDLLADLADLGVDLLLGVPALLHRFPELRGISESASHRSATQSKSVRGAECIARFCAHRRTLARLVHRVSVGGNYDPCHIAGIALQPTSYNSPTALRANF
jgi:hypothetical protein